MNLFKDLVLTVKCKIQNGNSQHLSKLLGTYNKRMNIELELISNIADITIYILRDARPIAQRNCHTCAVTREIVARDNKFAEESTQFHIHCDRCRAISFLTLYCYKLNLFTIKIV